MSEHSDQPAATEDPDWSALEHAYGPAADVPALLVALHAVDPDVHREAAEQLCGRLCHQGSVYTASVAALPRLTAVALDHGAPLSSRIDAALLAAACASALPPPPVSMPAGAQPVAPIDGVDCVRECQQALLPYASALLRALSAASVPLQAALLAALAPVTDGLPPQAADQLAALGRAPDPRLAAAARLCGHLFHGKTPTDDEVAAAAALDEDTADYLPDLTEQSPRTRAITITVSLCERVLGSSAA